MPDDHVSVKMGLDKSGFESGLKGVGSSLATFKGALGALGVSFSLGAVKGFFGGILDMADGLERQAEALSVTTDFLQEWQVAASESGSNAQEASKALDKFASHLAETGRSGADVEEEIRKLADRVANARTPIERVGLVSEAFGEKLGAKLTPALQGGSKALGEFIATAKKLTADEIQTLDNIGDALEKMATDAKVIGGSALVSVGKFAASLLTAIGLRTKLGFTLGNLGKDTAFISNLLNAIEYSEAATNKTLDAQAKVAARRNAIQAAYAVLAKEIAATQFDSLSAEDQLGKLVEFRKTLLSQIAKGGQSVENAQRLVAVEKISRDINERQKKIDEDRLQLAEKQKQATIDQANAQANAAAAKASLSDATADRSGLTLQELANATPGTRAGAQNVLAAQKAIAAEEFAKKARLEGRDDLADKATDYALGLRKRLSPLTGSERDPLQSLRDNMAKAKEALEAMREEGLKVIPQNGE